MITGLKTGGRYKFRVTAFNAAGNSEAGEVPEVLEVNDRTSESVWVSELGPLRIKADFNTAFFFSQLLLRLT